MLQEISHGLPHKKKTRSTHAINPQYHSFLCYYISIYSNTIATTLRIVTAMEIVSSLSSNRVKKIKVAYLFKNSEYIPNGFT